eukprot:TRINITY_DN19362_c0_g1_i1.p1 TRINITY_DN19362_c0_g1~~TRINITY_DN19362_c0_g1_i1.p1  ORF type:complete len:754 (+),score=163.05 TRINITY_DN19362_c0_g1_i1:74-2263(+)
MALNASAPAPIFFAGRPLLSWNDPSTLWDEGPMVKLKAAAEDAFFGHVWDLVGGLGSGGTMQTRRLAYDFAGEKAPRCSVCTQIYSLVMFAATFRVRQMDMMAALHNIDILSDIVRTNGLTNLFTEGWGFAFAFVAYNMVLAARQAGFFHDTSPEDLAIKQQFTEYFVRAVARMYPQSMFTDDSSKLLAVDFAGAVRDFQVAEGLVMQLLPKHGLGWFWLLGGGDEWLKGLLQLGLVWNSGAPARARRGVRGNDDAEHRLLRIARAEASGWSVAVVAASVTTTEAAVRELELLVVPQLLSQAPFFAEWAQITAAFKSIIPEEASDAVATCTWPSGARNLRRHTHRCRVLSHSSAFAGCRNRGCASPGHPVSSLRVRCPVPWQTSLEAGSDTRLVLNLHLPEARDASLGAAGAAATLRVHFVLRSAPVPPAAAGARSGGRDGVAVCLPPAFDYAGIRARWGDLASGWLKYHLSVLEGIDRVYIYDNDGSLAAGRGAAATWPKGVYYEGNFSRRVYGDKLWNQSCPYCAENIAYDHCLMSARHVAKHVIVLHGWDEWLVPAPDKGTDVAALLREQEPFGVAFLHYADMHSFRPNGTAHGGEFALAQHAVYRFAASAQDFTDPDISSLRHSVVVRPTGVTYIDTHTVKLDPKHEVMRLEQGSVELRGLRINHYIDYVSPRYVHLSPRTGRPQRFKGRPPQETLHSDYSVDLRMRQLLWTGRARIRAPLATKT